MQGKANLISVPQVESVTLILTPNEAKLLHKFVAGTTSNTVLEATGLSYEDKDEMDEIYAINDVLFEIHEELGRIKELELPSLYSR